MYTRAQGNTWRLLKDHTFLNKPAAFLRYDCGIVVEH